MPWSFYFFSKSFRSYIRSLIHFEFTFVYSVRMRVQLHSLACGYPVFPVPLVDKTVLTPLKWSWHLNSHFYKEDRQMASKHLKRLSTSRGKWIKISEILLHTTRVAIIKIYIITSVDEDMEKLESLHTCWWECIKCSCFGKVWPFLQRWHVELPCDSAIPLLGTQPREMKTQVHIKTWIQISIEALLLIA